MSGHHWRERALCQGMDVNLFYPETGQNAVEAKRACHACPVRAACLEDALRRRDRYGIWGGTAHRERDAMLADRKRAVTGAPKPTPKPVTRHGYGGYTQGCRCGVCGAAKNTYARLQRARRRERRAS